LPFAAAIETNNMASTPRKAELVKLTDEIAAAMKDFSGDQMSQMKLLKQTDKLRLLLEEPMDAIMKHWEIVSCSLILYILEHKMQLEFNYQAR
jgi:hypothetical protein